MTWSIAVRAGEVEYKYCMMNEDGSIAKWEDKGKTNRKVAADATSQDDGKYGAIPGAARAPPPGGPPTRENPSHGVNLGDAKVNMVRCSSISGDDAHVYNTYTGGPETCTTLS